MIVIAGSFRFDNGITNDVLDACRLVMEGTRAEEGCLDYIFYPDPLEEDILRVFERWVDNDSLQNHFTMGHVDAFRKAMGGWSISDREINKFETDTFDLM